MIYVLSAACVILLVYVLYIRVRHRETQRSFAALEKIQLNQTKTLQQQQERIDQLLLNISNYQLTLQSLEQSGREQLEAKIKQLEAEFKIKEQSIRNDAVQRAKVVNKGFDGETFSPFLMTDLSPKDFRHCGDPIDYVIYSGAENVRSGLVDEIDTILVLEIKTGGADLNKVQRRIRDAIVEGRVEFGLYNADEKVLRTWSATNPKGKYVTGTITKESIS